MCHHTRFSQTTIHYARHRVPGQPIQRWYGIRVTGPDDDPGFELYRRLDARGASERLGVWDHRVLALDAAEKDLGRPLPDAAWTAVDEADWLF